MFFLQIYLSMACMWLCASGQVFFKIRLNKNDRNDIKLRRTSRKKTQKEQKTAFTSFTKCKGGNPLISMFYSNYSWTILSMLPMTTHYN